MSSRPKRADERLRPPSSASAAARDSGRRGGAAGEAPASRAHSSNSGSGSDDAAVRSSRDKPSEPESAEGASAASAKPVAESSDVHERGRGRAARKPTDIPKEGWLDVLSRTKQQLAEDNLTVVAAGVAFYGFVAIVPALAAIIAIYGLIANPSQVTEQLTALGRVLPDEALPLLREQMVRITSNNQAAGIGAIVGVLIAIYSSANATKALIRGLNIAYDEREKRSFFKLSLLAITLTLGAIVGVVLAIGLVAVLPAVLGFLNIPGRVETVLNLLRWPILIGGFMAALAVLFRYGPCRSDAQWRWISPGALLATILWVTGSALFSLYVSKFGSYDKTYGPLGAVVVFLMWLFISAFVVLIGAELDAELERQTAKDTTEGREQPMGQRGAMAADTLGPARHKFPDTPTR